MPLHVTLGVLKKAMNEDVTSKGFLIDGFPRGQGQAKDLIAAFEKKVQGISVSKLLVPAEASKPWS